MISFVAKILTLAALMHSSLSSAKCVGSDATCMDVEDGTSLLQHEKIVNLGSKRSVQHNPEDEEEHPAEYAHENGFDGGVDAAEAVEDAAEQKRVFVARVADRRKEVVKATVHQLQDQKEQYAEAANDAADDVEDAAVAKADAQNNQMENEQEAKDQYVKSAIRKRKTQAAAVDGHNQGVKAAVIKAHHQKLEAAVEHVEEHRAKNEMKVAEWVKEKKQEKKAAVHAETERQAEAGAHAVEKGDKILDASVAHVDGVAHAVQDHMEKQTEITGGVAEKHVAGYQGAATEDEGETDEAADAR